MFAYCKLLTSLIFGLVAIINRGYGTSAPAVNRSALNSALGVNPEPVATRATIQTLLGRFVKFIKNAQTDTDASCATLHLIDTAAYECP